MMKGEVKSELEKIADIVGKSAPIVGAALGGSVGAIAGAAGSIIASTFGVESTPEAILSYLGNPEAHLKLKELEEKEKSRFLNWQTEQLYAELSNTKDARQREVSLATLGHGGAWVTGLVVLVVCVFFWMLAEVISQDNINEPALLLLRFLGTAFGFVVNYCLGSSLGSYRKNNLPTSASFIGGK